MQGSRYVSSGDPVLIQRELNEAGVQELRQRHLRKPG